MYTDTEGIILRQVKATGGRRMVSFDMDGGIYPCELTDWPEERLGSVDGEQGLAEMVAAAAEHPYFREKRKEACADCPWWYYCRGGCTSAVKYVRPQIEGVDEQECAMNQTLYPLLTRLLLQRPEEIDKWLR